MTNPTCHWIDLRHSASIYAFAADKLLTDEKDDMECRAKFMRRLLAQNALDRKMRIAGGECLYEPEREPVMEDDDDDDMMTACETRQDAKFNYVGKHKGKVAPKAKQLSDIYFDELLESDTYNYTRGF